MCLLGQAIHHDEDGIIAVTLGKFCDQVDQDNLPSMVWDAVGHEFSRWGFRECLHLVTEAAAFHILSDVSSHAQPPVVSGYQFSCLPLSQVSSHWGVVVGFHNVVLQLSIQGNVDLSSEQY